MHPRCTVCRLISEKDGVGHLQVSTSLQKSKCCRVLTKVHQLPLSQIDNRGWGEVSLWSTAALSTTWRRSQLEYQHHITQITAGSIRIIYIGTNKFRYEWPQQNKIHWRSRNKHEWSKIQWYNRNKHDALPVWQTKFTTLQFASTATDWICIDQKSTWITRAFAQVLALHNSLWETLGLRISLGSGQVHTSINPDIPAAIAWDLWLICRGSFTCFGETNDCGAVVAGWWV